MFYCLVLRDVGKPWSPRQQPKPRAASLSTSRPPRWQTCGTANHRSWLLLSSHWLSKSSPASSSLMRLVSFSICYVPMDVQTTGLLWYWREFKNVKISRQVLNQNESKNMTRQAEINSLLKGQYQANQSVLFHPHEIAQTNFNLFFWVCSNEFL